MNKIKILLWTFILAALLQPAFAAEIEPEGTALRKLQRGFLNMALSPMEASHEMEKTKMKDAIIPTEAIGLWNGLFHTFQRMIVGVYEVATFPIPLPAHYNPVLQPEFAWQYLPETPEKK